jgi:hypothetical protein
MKFHQVQIGQRFLYKDQAYQKVSPVLARHEESGEQKFLRRADAVQQLAEIDSPATVSGKRKNIEVKKVSRMFDDFYQQCVSVIEAELAELPAADKEKILAQLQQAGQDFVHKLSRPGSRKDR